MKAVCVYRGLFDVFDLKTRKTQRWCLSGCGCVSLAVTLQGTWKRKCRSWKPCWRSCRMTCKRCLDFHEYFPPLRISVCVSAAAEPAGRRGPLEGLQEFTVAWFFVIKAAESLQRLLMKTLTQLVFTSDLVVNWSIFRFIKCCDILHIY